MAEYYFALTDIDNVVKAVMDALHDVAYVNDASVVKVEAVKRYSQVAETVVEIRELEVMT